MFSSHLLILSVRFILMLVYDKKDTVQKPSLFNTSYLPVFA